MQSFTTSTHNIVIDYRFHYYIIQCVIEGNVHGQELKSDVIKGQHNVGFI